MRKYSSREIRKLACLYFQRQESDDSLGLEERLCSGTNEIRLEPYPEDWNRVTHTKHALRERVFRWNQIESHRCVFKRLRQHSFAGHRARHRRAKPLASRVNHASAGKQTGRQARPNDTSCERARTMIVRAARGYAIGLTIQPQQPPSTKAINS